MTENDCIFCKIANGEIPSATVYEDQDFRVILDMGPASRGHALILPKNHFADVCALDKDTAAKVLPLAARIGTAMKSLWDAAGLTLFRTMELPRDRRYFIFMSILFRDMKEVLL